jgi:hypothetical protein
MPAATPTRPLPAAVREKLGKLLPMLSSSHNGERVGAVAAIERVLKSNGFDWHDLTGLITSPVAAAPPPPPPPPRQSRPADPEDELGTSILDHELVALVEALRAAAGSRHDLRNSSTACSSAPGASTSCTCRRNKNAGSRTSQ